MNILAPFHVAVHVCHCSHSCLFQCHCAILSEPLYFTTTSLSHLPQPLPSLLPSFHNPCWYEQVPLRFNYSETFYATQECQNKKQALNSFPKFQEALANQSAVGNHLRLRCFPSVFLLGVPKAGTTSFFNSVTNYIPGLLNGISKESQFWVRRRFGITWDLCNPKRHDGR